MTTRSRRSLDQRLDILRLLREGPLVATSITNKVSIQHGQTRRYLEGFEASGCAEHRPRAVTHEEGWASKGLWSITSTGLLALETFEKASDLMGVVP